jgi:hypothetical protein
MILSSLRSHHIGEIVTDELLDSTVERFFPHLLGADRAPIGVVLGKGIHFLFEAMQGTVLLL